MRFRLLFNICVQLEKGNAEAFVAEIKKFCETDPRKALEFALGGAREKLEKVKLENWGIKAWAEYAIDNTEHAESPNEFEKQIEQIRP
jgi:hypothetical protein